MLSINLSTPSLLFPAISLIMLAYTNRFLGLSSVIRHLHGEYQQNPDKTIIHQIHNLRRRVSYIRNMQIYGCVSITLCISSMIFVFYDNQPLGIITFIASLVSMIVSLLISGYELLLSGDALNILLAGMEKDLNKVEQKHTTTPWKLRRRHNGHKKSLDEDVL